MGRYFSKSLTENHEIENCEKLIRKAENEYYLIKTNSKMPLLALFLCHYIDFARSRLRHSKDCEPIDFQLAEKLIKMHIRTFNEIRDKLFE